MKKIIISISIAILLVITSLAQQTTSFSYQGKLNSSSTPANGTYDFTFELYSAVSGGSAIGTVNVNGVTVTNGVFTVQLDFGANTFDGTDRFLDISVKQSTATIYTFLTPRQKLASVPFATKAIKSENADSLGGLYANSYLQKNGDASQLTNINGSSIVNNSVTSAQLSADLLPSNYNLKLLALRRWDLLKSQAIFPVGSGPVGIAFDGSNIWVANSNSNNIMKIRATDGTILGTFSVSSFPTAIAFDGANIWVTSDPNNVTKFRASDGVNLGSFVVGAGPRDLAFDGTNIWVMNNAGQNVSKLRASDGFTIGTFSVGSLAQGIIFDGSNIWVAVSSPNNLVKLRATDGATLGILPLAFSPQKIAFDGLNIWVTNLGSNSVSKFSASDGANSGTFTVGTGPSGIVFDGANMWITNTSSANVTRLRASDGANLGTFPVGIAPIGVAFDGSNIWVANLSGNTVTRLQPVFPQP